MKKIIYVVLLIAMCFIATACSSSPDNSSSIDVGFNGNFEIKDVENNVILTTKNLVSVSSGIDDSESHYVEIVFDDNGKDILFKETSENVGKKLGIYVDGQCISEPLMSTIITDGVVRITGIENEEQAEDIVIAIKEGVPEHSNKTNLVAQQNSDNLVSGKVYYVGDGNTYLVFYEDNTFQSIEYQWSYNYSTKERKDWYESAYGAYEIDEKALTLKISNEEYFGVVMDNGENIAFGDVICDDYTDKNFSNEFWDSLK